MPNSAAPKGPNLPKALEKALLGGMVGLAQGLMEDVMGFGKQSPDFGEVGGAYNSGVRREQIAAKILEGLASNIAAPLDQPDRLVSMAVDLANKLIARLDEEAKKDQRDLDALKKRIAESVVDELAHANVQAQNQGVMPFLTQQNILTPNPFVPNPFRGDPAWSGLPPKSKDDGSLASL